MHLMIDEETLGLDTVEGPLVQISVVPFELMGDGPSDAVKSFDIFLNPDQKHLGRTIEPGTLVFWLKENPALLLSILDGTLAASRTFDTYPVQKRQYRPAEAMYELNYYFWQIDHDHGGIEGVWANGPTFDCQFIEHMAKQTGHPLPWTYNAPRCVRTSNLFGDLLGHFWDEGTPTELEKSGAKHDSLVDCHRQIRWVQQTYKGLHVATHPAEFVEDVLDVLI